VPREGERRAEHGALQAGGEEIEHDDAEAEPAAPPLEDRIPEHERGEEERRVLGDVDPLVAQRRAVERRHVPQPEHGDVQRPGDQRQA